MESEQSQDKAMGCTQDGKDNSNWSEHHQFQSKSFSQCKMQFPLEHNVLIVMVSIVMVNILLLVGLICLSHCAEGYLLKLS